jgi:hypothetical protein
MSFFGPLGGDGVTSNKAAFEHFSIKSNSYSIDYVG